MELLQSMRLFARLAELGSFTKAAESLDIGRPQVTRYIQELETSLGVRLFQRTTRKVALTAEGELFYQRVQEILAEITAATTMFDRTGATLSGRLRIDIPTAFAQLEFIKSLREFTDTYPGIDMVLGVTDRAVDLVGEGIDCALRIGELPDSTLIARPIALATMVTCAAPEYLREHGTPETLADLTNHQGVNFLSGQNNRTLPWQFSVEGKQKAMSAAKALPSPSRTLTCSVACRASALSRRRASRSPSIWLAVLWWKFCNRCARCLGRYRCCTRAARICRRRCRCLSNGCRCGLCSCMRGGWKVESGFIAQFLQRAAPRI